MTEKEFNKLLGKIEGNCETGVEFSSIIDKLINMLEEADQDDYFGTEGFRHVLGWD